MLQRMEAEAQPPHQRQPASDGGERSSRHGEESVKLSAAFCDLSGRHEDQGQRIRRLFLEESQSGHGPQNDL